MIGLHTSPAIKFSLFSSTEKAFSANAIRFSDHFFTIEDKQRFIYNMKDQLVSFKKIIQSDPKKVFSRAKMTFSGKSSGSKDDIVLALQLLNFWVSKMRFYTYITNKCNLL
jgi:hypothetical protein